MAEQYPVGAEAAPGWGGSHAARHRRGLALGFLSMLPLFAAYELGLWQTAGARRNTSELLLFRAFAFASESQAAPRIACLVLASAVALVLCFRRRVALLPGVLGIAGEGALGAVLLGPALLVLMRLVAPELGPLAFPEPAPARPPQLGRAAFLLGGAAYEELLFRVGAYGLLYLLVRRTLVFLGLGARWGAELAALFGSSLFFAAFHLARFTAWLGHGGEVFSPAAFTWRALAGILLALLFRWRGPGVAAWTHGLFNLGLFLGAGPQA